MKFIKSLLSLMVLFSAFNAMAFSIDPDPNNNAVSRELSSMLGTPDFTVSNDDLLAKVHFLINGDREIVVVDVKAENELVEAYIKNRLNYKKVTSRALNIGKEYTTTVRILASR